MPREAADEIVSSLFTKDIGRVAWEDVEAFLNQGFSENERIDYKRDFSDSFAKTVVAMANTYGGHILVGVGEKPDKTPGATNGVSPKHVSGGTIATHCYNSIQPLYLPRSQPVRVPKSDNIIIVVRVEPDLPQRPLFHIVEGVLIRQSDQNRPADLDTLRRLLGEKSQRAGDGFAAAYVGQLGQTEESTFLNLAAEYAGIRGDLWTDDQVARLTNLAVSLGCFAGEPTIHIGPSGCTFEDLADDYEKWRVKLEFSAQ